MVILGVRPARAARDAFAIWGTLARAGSAGLLFYAPGLVKNLASLCQIRASGGVTFGPGTRLQLERTLPGTESAGLRQMS